MNNELYHYGIQGQKWGVRKYQNEDGTLTAEGRKRYLNNSNGIIDNLQRKVSIGNNFQTYKRNSEAYNKITEKMAAKKAAGKKISKWDKYRATSYGTNARVSLKKSKTYDKWLGREAKANNAARAAGLPFAGYNIYQFGKYIADGDETRLLRQFAALGGQIVAQTGGYHISQLAQGDYGEYKDWGKSIVNDSKNETINDLKKKGLL